MPDGNREFLDGKEIIETFVLTAALGAVTSTLRFNFFVLKLPIRPPALVAKQAGSLAALIGNRVGLGVGTSPWPEDYEVMGVPFANRGKRMDECIEIIRGLTTGEYFEFHGEFYDIPKTKMTPAPTEPLPILIGGHAEAALRRAARNDGWMHGGGGDPEELDRLITRLAQLREQEGRTGRFEIHVISMDAYTVDGIKRLEDKGVTDVIVGFRYPYVIGPDTQPLDSKIRKLERYAENVMAKV
jgi:alkanesulfonate monooxygenase SsuD/methylene tetrahydromethanopterin reductase-like flavin-dependent oxidoreductase (luciferase family)